jgi:hypothetical protein
VSWRGAYQQDHVERYTSYVLNTVLGGSMSSRSVPERPRKARACVCGLQRAERVSRRRLVTIYAGCANDAVGELDRCRDRGAAAHEGRAASGVGAAARQGSSQGKPDAELESTSSRMSHLAARRSTSIGSSASTKRSKASSASRQTDVQRVARELFSNGALPRRCWAR